MDYKSLIDQERAKIELLRAKQVFIASEIDDLEQMIEVLQKRAAKKGGDAFDKFWESQLADAPAAVEPTPLFVPTLSTAQAVVEEPATYEFPKVRADSMWPYLIRFMESKGQWRVEEIIKFARLNDLAQTESAVRSALSSLKGWGFLENGTPGFFSLKPKALSFLKGFEAHQFVPGGAAGTTHSENNA